MTASVFLSSTYRDLAQHRARLRDSLAMAGFTPIDMVHFGAQPEDPEHVSLEELTAADVFVGIYAYRYGYVPDDSVISITEMELAHAERLKKPVFCFLVVNGHHWSDDCSDTEERTAQSAELRRRVQKRYVASHFTTPDHLAALVVASLSRWTQKRGAGLHRASADYEVINPADFGTQPPDLRPGIPTVLLQIVDRVPQVRGLRDMLQRERVNAGARSKPFVFVVLGSTDDAQEGLVQLYREDILPAFFPKDRAVARNQYAPVVWPPSGNAIENLRRDLATALLLPANVSNEEIRGRLTSGIGGHSLAYFVDADLWTRSDGDLLLRWLAYWRDFPPTAAGKIVTIFICLQYSPSYWKLSKRFRLERFFKSVQRAFGRASNIVCLPRLSAIDVAHVVRWANTDVPSRSRRFNATLLKREATRPFGPTRRHIPLDILAPTLKNALELSQVTHASGPPPWTS